MTKGAIEPRECLRRLPLSALERQITQANGRSLCTVIRLWPMQTTTLDNGSIPLSVKHASAIFFG